uniref:NADH dehydrogenase [ubiquinone] 1 alpha subcomplex subunit 12 n=1 Tax=Echeneis naucrates TaxID=173247 RepID=A0A665VQX2_ECHNA
MAECLNIARRALGQLGGHGGVRGFLLQLFWSGDVKTGTLIGVDKYGNKYYEDKKHSFFAFSFTKTQKEIPAALKKVRIVMFVLFSSVHADVAMMFGDLY